MTEATNGSTDEEPTDNQGVAFDFMTAALKCGRSTPALPSGYNDHRIREEEVRGQGTVRFHRRPASWVDGEASRLAREAVEQGEAQMANVGSVEVTLWFRREDVACWVVPDGWAVESISMFNDPESRPGGSTAVSLRREGGDD